MTERDWYYDRAGQPITQDEWIALMARRDYKIVAQHQVGESWVSTVWLGLDHGFRGSPMIFETLVFGGRLGDEMERYSTEAQAWEGHAWMVGRVAAAQGEPYETVEITDGRLGPPT